MSTTATRQTSSDETPVTLDLPWLFTDEHRELRWQVRRFMESEIAPSVAERTAARRFDESLVPKIAEQGYFGIRVPSEFGGMGRDLTSMCIMLEEASRIDGSIGNLIETQSIVATLLSSMAGEDQKRELLPKMCAGETLVAFGLTESTGGSDAGHMATRAEREGDTWRVNGAKDQISSAGTGRSRYIVTFAATGPERAPRRPEISAFLVPLDAPGVELSEPYAKIGWAAADTREVRFNDVEVPESLRIGTEGKAYAEALHLVTWARLAIAAMAVGVMQGALEATLERIKTREVFGKPIGHHQDSAFLVADMAAKLHSARVLTYDGCYRHDNGLPYGRRASAAKLAATELANQVTYQGVELNGAQGLVLDNPVARLYGDARVLTIGEGPAAVQKMIISRGLGI